MKSTKHTVRKSTDLINTGLASPGQLSELEDVAARYAVAITPAFVDLIDPHNTSDPIAR